MLRILRNIQYFLRTPATWLPQSIVFINFHHFNSLGISWLIIRKLKLEVERNLYECSDVNDFFFHLIQIFFQNYPTPRSQKKGSLIKYGVGGLLLVLIIFIIWFPLVIFSFANTVYISNPPVGVTASIAIGGFQVGWFSISRHILMFSELIFSFYGLSKTCKFIIVECKPYLPWIKSFSWSCVSSHLFWSVAMVNRTAKLKIS